MDKSSLLIQNMLEHERGNIKRIEHFLKVYAFARAIALNERLDPQTMEIIEAASLVHDIGIRISMEKYGSSAPEYQQSEGAPAAAAMLIEIGYRNGTAERVSWLVAHHHEYDNIEDIDYQILVEADLLVNFSERNITGDNMDKLAKSVFKTASGKNIFQKMFREYTEVK